MTHKLLSIWLTALLMLVGQSLWAYDAKIDGIYYNFSGTSASVTYKSDSYNSYSGSVTIPSSVKYNGTTYSVTSIGNYAFSSCYELTSITIPNSVTSIGDYAFSGDDAFSGCTGLTNITIPNSVTKIGYAAFGSCSGLTSIEIPNSVTSIGDFAFEGCTGLNNITIPNSVTYIGYATFYACI